jgi:hypothetical protein
VARGGEERHEEGGGELEGSESSARHGWA